MTVDTRVGNSVDGGLRSPAAPRGVRRRRRSALQNQLIAWAFLAPAAVLFLYFKYIPMIEGIRLSLYKVQPFLGDKFVGLENYVAVVTDQRFLDALIHTVLIGVSTTVGGLVLGFALALLVEGESRRLWVVRTAVFLPVITATAVTGELWRVLYYPTDTGLINRIFAIFGLPASQFLNDPSTALWSIVAVGIWTSAPYNMVIVLAGLAGVDRNLYEAAAVDGAGRWRRLWSITLPGIRPALVIVLTLAAIRILRVFTEVYVLTGGGPAGSTEVWMTRVFSLGFERNDVGVASAASVLLFVATLALTLTVQAFNRRKAGR